MKIVQAFSGGLDSTSLLWKFLSEGHQVRALSVNYGQRHSKEIEQAKAIVEVAASQFPGKVEHRVADLSALRPFLAGSSQTDDEVEVPEGHYADPTMKLTVVPNRNMLLIATAAAWAVSSDSEAVAFAAHAGDHPVYPDCRTEFADAMSKALELCHYEPGIKLLRPFVEIDKTAVCKLGAELSAPLHLTWSCYQGRERHCGRCGTCVERIEAFVDSGVEDKTVYEATPQGAS